MAIKCTSDPRRKQSEKLYTYEAQIECYVAYFDVDL